MERYRKTPFIQRFINKAPSVRCPGFYKLTLSNLCLYDCLYCYLQGTFKGQKEPVIFTNPWEQILAELTESKPGTYNTGELADSFAPCPPHLDKVINFFSKQHVRYLLLVTKSADVMNTLKGVPPSPQVIISFSVNTNEVASFYEHGCPPPGARIWSASQLIDAGWRVRIRIDPIIINNPPNDIDSYLALASIIKDLKPELVTLGSLRPYPGVLRQRPAAPRKWLIKHTDGRFRYPNSIRIDYYHKINEILQPIPTALCKETTLCWQVLTWTQDKCNCQG